mgnify:FL=1|tara:strand:- start:347 stop:604 length:258 start_codon:yes stop_codon:yes gene_type:complete
MDKLRIRCRSCGKELEGAAGKSVCCGCSNMTTVKGDVISANDMSNVVVLSMPNKKSKNGVLRPEDIEWQEKRRQRKVRKLDFEVR